MNVEDVYISAASIMFAIVWLAFTVIAPLDVFMPVAVSAGAVGWLLLRMGCMPRRRREGMMSETTKAFEEVFPDMPLREKVLLYHFDYLMLDGVKYRVKTYEDNYETKFILKNETRDDE